MFLKMILILISAGSMATAQPSAEKEVDFSGLSQFNSGKDEANRLKATCTSPTTGTVSSGQAGYDACLRELERSKFNGSSSEPKNKQTPYGPGQNLQFETK